MADIKGHAAIDLCVDMRFTEAECRALDALVGYGDDAFIKQFYGMLGEHYLKPHEAGLRIFFKSIRENMPSVIARADAAREAFYK